MAVSLGRGNRRASCRGHHTKPRSPLPPFLLPLPPLPKRAFLGGIISSFVAMLPLPKPRSLEQIFAERQYSRVISRRSITSAEPWSVRCRGRVPHWRVGGLVGCGSASEGPVRLSVQARASFFVASYCGIAMRMHMTRAACNQI